MYFSSVNKQAVFAALLLTAALSAAPLSKRHKSIIDAMDWNHPLLKDVAPAYKSGNLVRTKKLLAEHFRKRGSDTSPIEKNPAFKLTRANEVCAGTVAPAHIRYTFAGGKIRWLYNPTMVEKGMTPNKEFTAQLNRMQFWKYLGEAYRATGDERYVKTFVEHFRSWLKQAPCPNSNVDGKEITAWRTIDTGIRLRTSWPDAFYAMGNSKTMTDDDVLDFFASSLEQMRFCLNFPAKGNWLTMQMNGVFRFASTYPEIKETAIARKKSVAVLADGFKAQILPDGFQCEQTPMYHNVAVGNTLNLVHTAYQKGFRDLITPELLALLEKSHAALVTVMTPDGSLPLFNDSGPGDLASRYSGKLLEIYPDNQLFRWIATDRKAGKAPDYVSGILPWAGYIAMRQSWDKKANLLIFDVGMPGKSHIHQDKLHFTLYSGAEELIFDDGGGSYGKSKYRTGPFAGDDAPVRQFHGGGGSIGLRFPLQRSGNDFAVFFIHTGLLHQKFQLLHHIVRNFSLFQITQCGVIASQNLLTGGLPASGIIHNAVADHVDTHVRGGLVGTMAKDFLKHGNQHRECFHITVIVDGGHTVSIQMEGIDHIHIA